MRSDFSKKNAASAILSNSIRILIGFVFQKIFLSVLGTKYLGLNGLFNNIISLLAITELGIGNAIIFSLYEPIAKKEHEKIKQLIDFYKKTYSIIMIAILCIGICIIPFLKYLINEPNISNISLFYIMFLFDTLLSYAVAYKISVLSAHQMDYIINIIQLFYALFMNLLQILFLLLTKSYFIYLLIKIICRLIQNYFISKKYEFYFSYLKDIYTTEIDKETKDDIIGKVKALIFHKISTFLVIGTDNIIISKYLGLVTVGLYSNYYMIINSIQSLFTQMFNSVISSIGNLLVDKDYKKSYYIYDKMLFLNYFVASFCSICLYFLIPPFISLWLGKQYLFDNSILFVLVLVFYLQMMRLAPSTFKSAAGICVEDKYVPLIESGVNLFFSILLVTKYGLIGVFIGTLLSTLVLHLYSYPKFIYKKLFHKKIVEYIVEQLKYFVMFIGNFLVVFLLVSLINIDNTLLYFVVIAILCVILSIIINIVSFYRTDYIKYYISFLKKKK